MLVRNKSKDATLDTYEEAIALTHKLKAALPFRVRAGKQLLQSLDDPSLTATRWLGVITVMYSGDEGGILLGLQLDDKNTSAYVVSLTQLVFDPEHELAAEVKDYQRQRVRRLMLQDRKGFASELLSQRKPKKQQPRKGFW